MKTPPRLFLLTISLFLSAAVHAARPLRIGVMPKLTGIDYFNAVERGARSAGKELGAEIVYDGPITNDVARQTEILGVWIARKFDAICVAPNDPAAIAPVLRRARARGIAVVTYDADAAPGARDLFVNQARPDEVARALIDGLAKHVGPQARYVILTGSLTAANQNIWMAEMERYRRQAFPGMVNLSATPKVTEEDQALATQVAIDSLKAYPNLQAMFALTSVALPGAAEGFAKAGAGGKVYLTGISTPRSMSPYVKSGVVQEVVLWNPEDLGYLAVQAAAQLCRRQIAPGAAGIEAGRLGRKPISDREVLLGPPLIFDRGNIDRYAF